MVQAILNSRSQYLITNFKICSLFLLVGLGASLCSLLFPIAANQAKYGFELAFAIRVILGATQGAMFPAVYVMFCEWLPKKERPKFLTFPSTFSRIGTIMMNLIVPIILKHLAWEWVFYISGGSALIWSVLFIVFASSVPQDNYWLSKAELAYIESHSGHKIESLAHNPTISASGFTINESAAEAKTRPAINWFKVLTNRSVLIMSVVMFTAEWSNSILLILLPKFLGPVFEMSCSEIGFWSSFMMALYCVGYPFFGWLATKLDNSSIDWFTPLRVRKLLEVVANIIQAAGCVTIAFCGNKYVVIGALYTMMVGRSMVGGGQCLMPPEISRGK